MKSVMTHQFSRVPHANIQRSTFRRDFGYKTTLDSGYLVPIYVDEALPGDTFQMKGTLFGRFSTPIVPIMDNVFLETFFFAVPYRLVWDHWVNFMGEQKNPGDSTDYVVPVVEDYEETAEAQVLEGSLADYFGIPTGVKYNKLRPSALFFRAYNLIWNEWFRNENLQDSAEVPTGDGPDWAIDYPLRRRCKRPDYFTSCLPWPQKGPGVEISLGGWAPVRTRNVVSDNSNLSSLSQSSRDSFGLTWSWINGAKASSGGEYGFAVYAGSTSRVSGSTYSALHEAGKEYATDSESLNPIRPRNLWADLSQSQAVTINTLRQAFQIQKLMESFARGGSRYIEVIRACFGVISPDARLQRPEYLGGGHSQIHFAPVTQTSSTDNTTPQGNMAAYGVVGGAGHGFTKSFTEHCIIMGLVNVRCDLNYQQGLPRMFSRRTKLDFYWPTLAHLGEQAVLNKEIYAQGSSADDDVFGYQERYAEYRYYPSKITGKFRSSDPQSLDVWHLAQDFASLPQLNSEFIEDRPPVKRILAVQNEPELLLDCYFQNISTRPMPLYGTPGLVDHF